MIDNNTSTQITPFNQSGTHHKLSVLILYFLFIHFVFLEMPRKFILWTYEVFLLVMHECRLTPYSIFTCTQYCVNILHITSSSKEPAMIHTAMTTQQLFVLLLHKTASHILIVPTRKGYIHQKKWQDLLEQLLICCRELCGFYSGQSQRFSCIQPF